MKAGILPSDGRLVPRSAARILAARFSDMAGRIATNSFPPYRPILPGPVRTVAVASLMTGRVVDGAVLSRADQAMYRAKHLGRNQVVPYSAES